VEALAATDRVVSLTRVGRSMLLPKSYEKTVNELYKIAGPVIRYRIDSELLEKTDCFINDYYNSDEPEIKYWLSVHRKNKIHGKDDVCFENAISKLLDYGFSKEDDRFHDTFKYLLDDLYWTNKDFNQIIIYPFLIRAGYHSEKNIHSYFRHRLEIIENTIDEVGYDFQEMGKAHIKKYENEFRFINEWIEKPLPTIYDVYAYAYYPKNDELINKKIEKIIKYILNDKFQRIPNNAYVYDKKKKRYYAAGSVYHACLKEERKLLNILLFSNFPAIKTYQPLIDEIKGLLQKRTNDGLFLFDKEMVKEQKNKYLIYSGAHMGLAENRKQKDAIKIESSFWMLKILSNLNKNDVIIK
jgi:hypothetical protein